jgi:beta-N-acetylhexosaminidase
MKLLISLFFSFIFFLGFSQTYSLKNFYKSDTVLDNKIDSIFNLLNDTSRVGQMIVPAIGRLGKSRDHVLALAQKGWIGGILLLNGTFEEFSKDVKNYDSTMIAKGHLPLIFSADAEPTLVNRKIIGSQKVPYTNTIHSMDSVEIIASIISEDLNKIGINQNYAPVIDASPNKVVSNRSFGLNMDTVISFSDKFINTTQKRNIIATAKHFPGHGYVKGDTHKELIFIDGEMKEVENYIPLIQSGVISIMVAHLAVKNNEEYNTFGFPSTCSRNIVTDLLKDSLEFKGLIVTDALNMGGVANFENNGLKAAQAGCDQLLMPLDEEKVLLNILELIAKNKAFKNEIYNSVKKIIRLKICLGKLI